MHSENSPSPAIIKALWRQQKELISKHPEGIKLIFNEEDCLDIQADIEGPKGTPYENGIFRVKIFVCGDFPISAPKGNLN